MTSDIKILVVDDEPDVLFCTSRILKQAGYIVLEAKTGEEAIQSAREHRPDLVLLDVALPDIDGFEVCRILKSNERTSGINIIFITGKRVTTDEKSLGLEEGADEYILRPIENRELLARVRALLRLRTAEKELQKHRNHLEELVENRTAELRKEIATRKQAEDALANAKKQWEETFDAVWDWVIITDKNCTIIRSNKASENFVNLSPKQVVGQRFNEVMHGLDCPKLDCPMERAVTSKQRERLEIQLENGRWIMVSVDPFENESNDELFVHIIRDITDRKRAAVEKDKHEAQHRQLQKAKSLDRMAGAIAHKFNNQLQVVIGNLEMAMDDRPLEGGSEGALSEALKAARKAAEVSALMLTYSGKLPGKHEPIDLSATCRQGFALLQTAAPKGTILKADFPASGPVIRCNAGQIQQVLVNLVTNAWESTGDNRRCIGLTVKTVPPADIPAFKRFPAGWKPQEIVYACLEVMDVGCGIGCKDIEKIFDPFYTTKFTGRGMGLSVVLGIVKAHNGGITVVSEPGRGSIFRIFLPLSEEEVPSQTDKATQTSEIQAGGTVLLIEDEEQVRKMAKTMLTHLGYNVIEAKDGVEAVEIFQQHQDEIRCVLSDLTMPRMNGWDTLAALRKLSPDIPVILSSGYDEARVMANEHTEQPNAFLGKPYRLQQLRDTIRHTLADKKKA